MYLINELLNSLADIDYSSFDENSISELLDSRDSDPFDAEWCRVSAEIELLKNDRNYTRDIEAQQSKIREKAFMTVERNIQSELSEYVSDDFGLIFDSIVLNYKDVWLDKLIDSYKNKKIPSGEL